MSGRSGPELRIEMLGGFRVISGARAVEESAWRLRKARALVKLLALTPEHSLHREQVIEALWPDLEPAAASNNLRQALFVARRALDSAGDSGGARLELALDVLALKTDGLSIDVEEFEAAAALVTDAPTIERHRAAIELYGGELLPEDRFEPWAAARREALTEKHLALMLALADLHERDGDFAGALGALQEAIQVEPLHERAHRELMRIYALTGRRQRALAQFHLLREALRREFEDEPDDDTRRLYQDILARRIGSGEETEPASAPRRTEAGRGGSGNLPLQLTSFVGRDRELREVVGLLRRHRLVTLTGPGGCGKTRLALEAAGVLRRDQPDGVWLVELAGLSDGALVPDAVASALGVESRSARPSEEAVAAHVGEQKLLIVLDNCEHLVGACARLAEALLSGCAGLSMLVTSREPLHAAGEVDWRVPSLSPQEASRLFVERATSVSSRFSAGEDNADAVAEICRRVDGIPLAIELAAARVGVLAPAQIAQRLRDSLSVLAAARRTALTRQQTLTATLDWSHELLDDSERSLFRRLGVFAGDFDLEAVEAVCDGELDLLAQLIDKSLVVVEEHDGSARYLLLDTVRHYAREKLAQAGEAADLETRHRIHYLSLAERFGPMVSEPEPRRRLALEADEMRFTLRHALVAEPQEALRLAAALWRFWHDRGDRTEGARWLDSALKAAPEPSPVRAAALHGRSVLALRTSQHEIALRNADEAIACVRQSSDRRVLSQELHHRGTLAWVFGDYAGAIRWCSESQALAEELGADPIAASVLHTLGVIAASRGHTEAGREQIAASIERLRALPPDGDPLLLPVAHGYARTSGPSHRWFLEQTWVTARRVKPAGAVAYALCDLAAAMRDADDMTASRRCFEEALTLFRGLGDQLGAAQALCQLGNLLSRAGEHEPARELLDESLSIRRAGDEARGVGLSLLSISLAEMTAGEFDRARGAADQALALFDRTADGPGQGAAWMVLGYIAASAEDWRHARELQERGLATWRNFNPDARWCGGVFLELVHIEMALGESERAAAHLRDAFASFEHVDDPLGLEQCRAAERELENVALTAD